MRLTTLALSTALIALLAPAPALADQPPPEDVRDAARAVLEAVFGPLIDPVVEAGRLANRTAVHTASVEAAEAAREAAEAAAHAEWHRQQEAAAQVARGSVWDRLAQCESNGRWNLNVGLYDGGLQFHPKTWIAAGGGKYAPYAWQATREQQIAIAESWLAKTSWAQWPACSKKLGLR